MFLWNQTNFDHWNDDNQSSITRIVWWVCSYAWKKIICNCQFDIIFEAQNIFSINNNQHIISQNTISFFLSSTTQFEICYFLYGFRLITLFLLTTFCIFIVDYLFLKEYFFCLAYNFSQVRSWRVKLGAILFTSCLHLNIWNVSYHGI